MSKDGLTNINMALTGKGYIMTERELKKLAKDDSNTFYLFADIGKCVYDSKRDPSSNCYVYDHHTFTNETSKKIPSATQMIISDAENIYKKIDQYDDCKLVTHRPPDVDSVCSVAMTKFIYNSYKELENIQNPAAREERKRILQETLKQFANLANKSDSFTFEVKRVKNGLGATNEYSPIINSGHIVDEYINSIGRAGTSRDAYNGPKKNGFNKGKDRFLEEECISNCVDMIMMLAELTYKSTSLGNEPDLERIVKTITGRTNVKLPPAYSDKYHFEMTNELVKAKQKFEKKFLTAENEMKEIRKNSISTKEFKSESYKLDPKLKEYSCYEFKTSLCDPNDKKAKRGFYGMVYTGDRKVSPLAQKQLVDNFTDLLIMNMPDVNNKGFKCNNIKIMTKADFNLSDFGRYLDAEMTRDKLGITAYEKLRQSGASEKECKVQLDRIKNRIGELSKLSEPTEQGDPFSGSVYSKENYVNYKCSDQSKYASTPEIIKKLKKYMENPVAMTEKEYLRILTGGSKEGYEVVQLIDKRHKTKLYEQYIVPEIEAKEKIQKGRKQEELKIDTQIETQKNDEIENYYELSESVEKIAEIEVDKEERQNEIETEIYTATYEENVENNSHMEQ